MRPNYALFVAVLLGANVAHGAGPIDFDRSIEPILADNCYPCHGPDPGGRKAGLRLDRGDVAFSVLKDHKRAIVPGDVEHSELLKRVTSTDPDEHMPPSGHEALRPDQVQVLREWIAQGAKYRDHWAFEKPVRPAISSVNRADWAKNPIDQFLIAGLEAHGLSPRPEAGKEELIRRVTLDLTGLLPTPAETSMFVADDSTDAYEKLVDHLLVSPRFGEHRAHYWLDYARYGDTHGLHNDNYRDIWPYRDYVIRAF